jgi:hypothetical protein
MKHSSRLLIICLIIGVLFLGMAMSVLAEDDDPALSCIPFARSLAVRMGVECEEIMALHAEGIGLGQIMMAWNLSLMAPEDGLTWEELLQRRVEEDLGWGQVKMAYRLATAFDADPEELLARKVVDGLGWGQIKQAYALADADLISVDGALELFALGLEWGDVRDALGLAPGPPPWAGGPNRAAPSGAVGRPKNPGPPPWAGRPGGRP